MPKIRATVRLQFHKEFTFADAQALVPYFSQMGISHIYASPILKARQDSMHGYDLVDPTIVNPQIGGEEGLVQLAAELKSYDMGLLVDIVSNHMAVGGDANPWWLDVLKWGPYSQYAEFFDVQWQSVDPSLRGMLLVPFLQEDYGKVLLSGNINLQFDKTTGEFYFTHGEHKFPLSPLSLSHILFHSTHQGIRKIAHELDFLNQVIKNISEDHMSDLMAQAHSLQVRIAELAKIPEHQTEINRLLGLYDLNSKSVANAQKQAALKHFRQWPDDDNLNRVHSLLELQHYRLASWRTASDDINWRRFFDVNDLGGIRVERQDVFEAIHGKIFELIEKGIIQGLRIDHIDGLANPRAYCRKLRRRINNILAQQHPDIRCDHFPIYVEKILTNDEQLHTDWMLDGTTGYEFMNNVSLLQHDQNGHSPLATLWSELSDRAPSFKQEIKKARRLVLSSLLVGDVETVTQDLVSIARFNLMTRDITLSAIRRALIELVVNFSVYRTYVTVCGRYHKQDRAYFSAACKEAKNALIETDWPVLEYIELWLGGESLASLPLGEERLLRRRAIARFQQLTSPTAAKAVEDTACYRSAVLLSRNDVGFNPQRFSLTPSEFHEKTSTLASHFPNNLLLTASHDHKRGEDTRARIAVISERATWFKQKINEWFTLAKDLRIEFDERPVPSAGDEIILYQTLLGTWPLDLQLNDKAALDAYKNRLLAWQEKAIREAKLESQWTAPNTIYEEACAQFLTQLLTGDNTQALRVDIAQAALSLAPGGAINGLVQTLLRMTIPGMPDLYQGNEFWDFSLVEPDNRQAVDYKQRVHVLARSHNFFDDELLEQWQDGRVKQWLIYRTLTLRKNYAHLFSHGDYQPLEVEGEHADRIVAFLREHKGICMIVIVPRLTDSLLGESKIPFIQPSQWQNTLVRLPPFIAPYIIKHNLISAIDGRIADGFIYVRDALARFPCYMSIAEYTEQT